MKNKIIFLLSALFVLSALCVNAQVDTSGISAPSGADVWSVISGILSLCDINCPVAVKVLAPMVLGWVIAWLKKRKEHKALAGIIQTTMAKHDGQLPVAHETALQKIIDHLKRKKVGKNG